MRKALLAIIVTLALVGTAAPAWAARSVDTTTTAATATTTKAQAKKAKAAAKKAAAKAEAAAKKAAAKAKADRKKFLAAQPIFTQAGSGTATTASFKVPNSWNLAWSYDCSKFLGGTGNFATTNYDLTGSAGGSAASGGNMDFDNQGVNQLGAKGAGVEHYHSGGNTKYIKVLSECDWTMTVTRG